MTKRTFLPLLGIFFSLYPAFTQISSDGLWKEAWSLARISRWKEAAEYLRPHILPPPPDSLAPHLLQLYALACWRSGDQPSALATLEKIKTEYPSFSGMAETEYLWGETDWRRMRYSRAWIHWASLPPEFSNRMKGLEPVPKDTVVKWEKMPPVTGSVLFTDWLATQKEKNPFSPASIQPRIGLVFPFSKNELFQLGPGNPVADFYRGMVLANEVCIASDSGLEFHIFDSQGSEARIREMTREEAFRGLDLLVGPLKASLIPAFAEAGEKSGLPMIQPLSGQTPAGSGRNFLLSQPGFSTVARECFSFISKHSPGNKFGIIYGPERSDSLLAVAYRDHLKLMGRQPVLFRKVGKNSAGNLTKFLVEAGLDSTDHVFAPNNEPLVRVQLLSAYGWMKSKYPILVYGRWLEADNADYDEFIRNPIFFADPDLPMPQTPDWQAWQSSYIARWGTPPSWVAWKGFDFVRWLSRQWYGTRNYILSEGKRLSRSSEIFGEYRFSDMAPDNQYVPIYRMEKEGILKVWPE